jgi:hypothetical protein
MKSVISILLSLLLIKTYAQESQHMMVKNEESIKVDGDLSEHVWSTLNAYNQFYNHFPIDSGKVKNAVDVKTFHDGNTLYIGVMVIDESSEFIVRSLKRDEGYASFINGDGFAMVLDLTGEQNSGYFFAVNVKGAQTDGIISITNDRYNVDSSWNSKWQSKTTINGNKRYYEIAIPLTAIPYNVRNKYWHINLVNIDAKAPQQATLTSFSRNYSFLDLRFTAQVAVQELPVTKSSKVTLIPSIGYVQSEDLVNNYDESQFNAGLDIKYNITPSLKLDASINPDFSTIEQDDQITNLTRFDISFPERRNFFLENGDLFNNLGARGVNPFYSRIIGSDTDMQFGLKLSGNVSDKFRLGLLNAQTESTGERIGQNYTVAVGRQNISKSLTATGYLVNRQATKKDNAENNYNRVLGTNLNFISTNNKWLGQFSYGKSLTPEVSGSNNFFNTTLSYSTRKWLGSSSTSRVGENYIADVGFVPRLNNYDAVLNQSSRIGYWENYTEIIYNNYGPSSAVRDKNEHKIRVNTFLNADLQLVDEEIELVNIWRYKDLSYFFLNAFFIHNNLQFPTDILRNGNPLPVDRYQTAFVRLGYVSPPSNRAFSYQNRFQYGSFYNGDRFRWELVTNYRLQPWANLSANYNLNVINLEQYGSETIHTVNFKGSVFFNNKLSWTTVAQLNTQNENLGLNTRLQWEFKPLSFAYLVISDNHSTDDFGRKNSGIALKINYWLDI